MDLSSSETYQEKDIFSIPFVSKIYKEILHIDSQKNIEGKVWSSDKFFKELTKLLHAYLTFKQEEPFNFYDNYLYENFSTNVNQSYTFTLEFISSYQRHFSCTFEGRTFALLFENEVSQLKPLIKYYLKCRSIVFSIISHITDLGSADNIFLTKKQAIDYLSNLLNDEDSTNFIVNKIEQEEKFLKIVHETKCDTSGLSKYLLCFLRNDLHNISLSYILEYIFKSFISNSKSNSKDDRLIEMLMKKLNVKDISSFIHNSLFSVYSSKNFANT